MRQLAILPSHVYWFQRRADKPARKGVTDIHQGCINLVALPASSNYNTCPGHEHMIRFVSGSTVAWGTDVRSWREVWHTARLVPPRPRKDRGQSRVLVAACPAHTVTKAGCSLAMTCIWI